MFVAPQVWRPQQLSETFFNYSYEQHACIGARIEPFFDTVTNIWELAPENNEAQSNYTWTASSKASPASREVSSIVAVNPFDKPATVSFTISQPHPLFRIYIDHRWVHLQPGEKRRIGVLIESLLGDRRFDDISEPFSHHDRRIETTARISAYGDTHESCAPSLLGGVAILAMTGSQTEFGEFESDGDHASGHCSK